MYNTGFCLNKNTISLVIHQIQFNRRRAIKLSTVIGLIIKHSDYRMSFDFNLLVSGRYENWQIGAYVHVGSSSKLD